MKKITLLYLFLVTAYATISWNDTSGIKTQSRTAISNQMKAELFLKILNRTYVKSTLGTGDGGVG